MHRPTIISPTRQSFFGKTYYLCNGKYFQRGNRHECIRLHREVYKANYGPIRKGYDVHHKDEDKANNNPENLELKTRSEHIRHHSLRKCNLTDEGRRKGHAWHSTPEGKAWHKAHCAKNADKFRVQAEFSCHFCGCPYKTQLTGCNRFCSGKCRNQHRLASGVDDEQRTCLVCSKPFVRNKHIKTKTCGRGCGAKYRTQKQRQTKLKS